MGQLWGVGFPPFLNAVGFLLTRLAYREPPSEPAGLAAASPHRSAPGFRYLPPAALNSASNLSYNSAVKLAEGVGFEPTRAFTPYALSRRAVSTAHAPFRLSRPVTESYGEGMPLPEFV